MNRRELFAVVLILVIASSVIVWLFSSQIGLQNQISELQTQIDDLQDQNRDLQDQNKELQDQNIGLQDRLDGKYGASPVRIIAAKMTGWETYVGLTIRSRVNVMVQNNGTTELSGLILNVRLVNFNNTDLNFNNADLGEGFSRQIDGLRAGETREFSGYVYYGYNWAAFAVYGSVELGDMVLSQLRLEV